MALYKEEMNALQQLADEREAEDRHKADAGLYSQLSSIWAQPAKTFAKRPATESEIMAKVTPVDYSGEVEQQLTHPASIGYGLAQDRYKDTLDKFKTKNAMITTLNKLKAYEDDREMNKLQKDFLKSKIEKQTLPVEQTPEYKILDKKEKQAEKKIKQKIQREDKKEQKKVKWDLTTKREKLDKDYKDFERLYGSINVIKDKFNAGKIDPSKGLNPQDRLQLIRLLVPLTEINPGVVREGEVAMVQSQMPVLEVIKSATEGKITGERITDAMVSDMLDTADTLKPVVANKKVDDLGNLKAQIDDYGLSDDTRIILGTSNFKLLSDPSLFARYGESVKTKSTSESKPNDAISKMNESELDRRIEMMKKKIQIKKTLINYNRSK